MDGDAHILSPPEIVLPRSRLPSALLRSPRSSGLDQTFGGTAGIVPLPAPSFLVGIAVSPVDGRILAVVDERAADPAVHRLAVGRYFP